MILRARNLFLAWLAYGALQLALLGVPGAAAQPGVGNRSARTQSESQSVSFGKRVAAPDISDRRAPVTPFAPAAASASACRQSSATRPSSSRGRRRRRTRIASSRPLAPRPLSPEPSRHLARPT